MKQKRIYTGPIPRRQKQKYIIKPDIDNIRLKSDTQKDNVPLKVIAQICNIPQ